MNELHTYKTAKGYENQKHVHFPNLESFLQEGILNFCGCGNPTRNLYLVLEMLEMRVKHQEQSNNLKDGQEEWATHWAKSQKELRKYVKENWKSFLDFFWYVMNEKNITEHGGGIAACWINDDNLLEALKIWRKHEETS